MDPITLAVIRGGFEQIAEEMDTLLIRSALSPIIAETNDMAHGIYHPETGETIAQGPLGLPVFLANMQFTVQSICQTAGGPAAFRPGDVWLLNDPYIGGTHLQDIQLVRPVFYRGELFAFLSNTGHWMDIGGTTPGGWAPQASNHFEEGILIPPFRLYREGVLNEDALDIILANVRLPAMVKGDLSAMINSLQLGERRLNALIDRYGLATVRACLDELIDRSERQMRSYIAEIPDGTYQFVDYLDNDGVVDEPLKIEVTVQVEGSSMAIDFAGTGEARTRAPMNLSRNTTLSSCYVTLKHLFPDVPINGGTFKPIAISIPENSFLAARNPQAVSGYLELVGRVIDVLLGALSQAIPERAPAAPFGTTGVVTIGGVNPANRAYYVGVFPYPGGYGGSLASDGLIHGNTPQSMANFVSLEASEHRYPVLFDWFAVREDSGGPGFRRGGCGSSYCFRLTSEEAIVSVLGDRQDYSPFGVHGGQSGGRNEVIFHRQEGDWVPPMRTKIDRAIIRRGEGVELHSPGGGGYGDPLARELELVEQDLQRDFISRQTAEQVYGVVAVEAGQLLGRPRYRLDYERSRARRAELQRVAAAAR